jgi:hypothetical protein
LNKAKWHLCEEMAAVYNYLLNLHISIIGNPTEEQIIKHRTNVTRGGGTFEEMLKIYSSS